MAIFGEPRNYHMKYNFVLEIDGLGEVAFQKCSELSTEITKMEHYEGGSIIPYTAPARVKFSDITLERGVTGDRKLYDWFQLVIEAASGLGVVNPLYRKNLALRQQERDGSTLRRWAIFNAWPNKFTAGDWDNTSDDAVIESVTLVHDYHKLVQ